MADTLNAVLDGRQLPLSPLLLSTDSPVFPGIGIVKEILRRGVARRAHTVFISVLHSADSLLPPTSTASDTLRILDYSDRIAGYGDVDAPMMEREILNACGSLPSGSQVVVDAIDILAEDHTPRFAIQLVRSILKSLSNSKGSRLVVSLPSFSPLLSSLIPPALSPALTHLHPLSSALVTSLSRSYLARVEPSPAFWQILENAKRRRVPEDLAYRATEGANVDGLWDKRGSSSGSTAAAQRIAGSGVAAGAVVQILVRKAAGGTKGMSRHLAALAPLEPGATVGAGLQVKDVGEILRPDPLSDPGFVRSSGASMVPKLGAGAGGAHDGLDLPFNLSLTEEQKRRRGQVALPYVHEGEGGADVDVGMDWDEEDEDDEEI